MAADQYWAAAPIEAIAHNMQERYDAYKTWGTSTGYFDRVLSCYDAFYGFNKQGTLRVVRNKDDVAELSNNQFKSLIKRLHILVTENKLAFQPRARNSDAKSQIEADLARGIVEYYGDERAMNTTFSRAVLGALIQLERYIHAPWDVTAGMELTQDGSQPVRTGDQIFEEFGPLDVAKCTSTEKSQWYIVRKKVNKFDEAALHPEFADIILSASLDEDIYDVNQRGIDAGNGMLSPNEDLVYKYILYHERTPAVPAGRRVEVIAGQVLLDDAEGLRYDTLPVFRISAGDVLDTGFGDSPAIEILPLQQALDALFSGTITNNLNNSVQLIWSQDPNLTVRTLNDGQKLVTSASPPQALNLTSSSPENYKMIELLMQHQQLLSGVNDVARGNPSSQLKSGASLAVVLAQAIQYVSDLQKNYARLASDVASCLVANIKRFADEEMTAYIVGESRAGEVQKFRAHDLLNIERVTVDLGNPLTQSVAGRSEMAAAWQQYGIMTNPKQIVSFLRTGEIDQNTENPFSDSILIRTENEQLRKGEVPEVLITDNHAEHIIEHKAIMSSPEARANPAMLAAWTAHVQEHLAQMRTVPPDLAAVLSGQPLPPPQQPAHAAVGGTQDKLPEVDGANMPSLPPGAPAQTQVAYQQALNAVPPSAA